MLSSHNIESTCSRNDHKEWALLYLSLCDVLVNILDYKDPKYPFSLAVGILDSQMLLKKEPHHVSAASCNASLIVLVTFPFMKHCYMIYIYYFIFQ